jgi:hypothetical protein
MLYIFMLHPVLFSFNSIPLMYEIKDVLAYKTIRVIFQKQTLNCLQAVYHTSLFDFSIILPEIALV